MLLSDKQLAEIKAMVDTLPNLPWGLLNSTALVNFCSYQGRDCWATIPLLPKPENQGQEEGDLNKSMWGVPRALRDTSSTRSNSSGAFVGE